MTRDIWTSGMFNAEIDHLLEKVARLEDELAKVREVNADQAKHIGEKNDEINRLDDVVAGLLENNGQAMTRAERLEDEAESLRESIRAYQQDTRQRMARE